MTRRILLTILAMWTFLEASAQPVAWRDHPCQLGCLFLLIESGKFENWG